MLSPDVVTVGNNFASAYSEILSVDRFAFAGMNILIGKLSPDPAWLGPVRTRVGMLADVARQWQQDRPDIWSAVLMPFVDYATLFKGFADTSSRFGDDRNLWIEALQQLQNALQANVDKTKATAGRFTTHIDRIKNVESLLTESLNTAWQQLADEEQAMIDIAAQITRLQDLVNQLQDNITSAEISSGKSYVQTAVTISYDIVTEAATEIPYLSILSEIFTIGKLGYDLIVTDKEIADAVNQIVALRVKASEEAQAAAETKAVIHLIDNLNVAMASMQDQLPPFADMWASERDKVAAAISGIRAGAEPRHMIDLVSMPAAAASWQTLADLVPKLTQGAEPGKPVTISTSSTTQKTQIGV